MEHNMVAMKLLVLLMVLVTAAKGDDGVTREEMSRHMRTMEETIATLAAKVDMEVTSIKQICQVQ